MIPILLIITGVVIFFLSLIGIVRYSSEFLERLEEMNRFFSSDAFSMIEDTRRELDELNFSYYEILERQDERISGLETRWKELMDFGFFDFDKNKASSLGADAGQKFSEAERGSDEAEELREQVNRKVLALHAKGKSAEEIAGDLDIGVGVAEMICSIYRK